MFSFNDRLKVRGRLFYLRPESYFFAENAKGKEYLFYRTEEAYEAVKTDAMNLGHYINPIHLTGPVMFLGVNRIFFKEEKLQIVMCKKIKINKHEELEHWPVDDLNQVFGLVN